MTDQSEMEKALKVAEPLMRFYGVDSLAELIEAQSLHVEKLSSLLNLSCDSTAWTLLRS